MLLEWGYQESYVEFLKLGGEIIRSSTFLESWVIAPKMCAKVSYVGKLLDLKKKST